MQKKNLILIIFAVSFSDMLSSIINPISIILITKIQYLPENRQYSFTVDRDEYDYRARFRYSFPPVKD